MKSPPFSTLTLLAVLAAGSWWLVRRLPTDEQTLPTVSLEQPGYYLRDATVMETDDAGRLALKLTTKTADQDPKSGEIQLSPVRVDYFPEGGSAWLLTAQNGRLPENGRVVTLYDQVTLSGTPLAKQVAAIVRSPTMSLDTTTSIASTSAPVSIEMGSRQVTATGLWADLKQDRLTLKSDVKGQYVR